MVAGSPGSSVYDEGWYLQSVELVARFGFTREFLLALPGPAGPTFTWVYAAVDAVFGIGFPWVRLTNVVLLVASAWLLGGALACKQRASGKPLSTSPWLIGGALTALPMVAVSAGMALTELPAFFFLCLFLFILARTFPGNDGFLATALLGAALAGLCLGLAVLGRQNYLVVLACLPLMAPRLGRSAVAYIGVVWLVALAIVAPVFLVWGDLVPPKVSRVSSGYSPWHFLLACAYASIAALLLAPRLFQPLIALPWLGLASLAAGAVLAPLADFSFLPMRPFVVSVFGEGAAGPLGSVAAIGLAVLGLAFLVALAVHALRNRGDLLVRFSAAVLLLGLLSVGRIEHVFSSRYTLVFFPFLVLALAKSVRPDRHLPFRLALGAALGLVSLARYFAIL